MFLSSSVLHVVTVFSLSTFHLGSKADYNCDHKNSAHLLFTPVVLFPIIKYVQNGNTPSILCNNFGWVVKNLTSDVP